MYWFELDLADRAGKTPPIRHRPVSNWGILSVIAILRQLNQTMVEIMGTAFQGKYAVGRATGLTW